VNDKDVRLLRDQRRYRLSARIRTEMRVADLTLHPQPIGLVLHDRRPPFGKVS